MAIFVDVSPGSKLPPPKLGPYAMTPFGPDPQPLYAPISSVSGAGIVVSFIVPFKPPPTHLRVPKGFWGQWRIQPGHVWDPAEYWEGSVYWADPDSTDSVSLVLLLNPSVAAFSFYVQPAQQSSIITATAQNGTSHSLAYPETLAQYFGFYATDGDAISIILVTSDEGSFAIGEFTASESGHRRPRKRAGGRREEPPPHN